MAGIALLLSLARFPSSPLNSPKLQCPTRSTTNRGCRRLVGRAGRLRLNFGCLGLAAHLVDITLASLTMFFQFLEMLRELLGHLPHLVQLLLDCRPLLPNRASRHGAQGRENAEFRRKMQLLEISAEVFALGLQS